MTRRAWIGRDTHYFDFKWSAIKRADQSFSFSPEKTLFAPSEQPANELKEVC